MHTGLIREGRKIVRVLIDKSVLGNSCASNGDNFAIAPNGLSVLDGYTAIYPPAEIGLQRSAACRRGETNSSDASYSIVFWSSANGPKLDLTLYSTGLGYMPKKREPPAPPNWNRTGRPARNSKGSDAIPPARRACSALGHFLRKPVDVWIASLTGFKVRRTKLSPRRQKRYATDAKHKWASLASGANRQAQNQPSAASPAQNQPSVHKGASPHPLFRPLSLTLRSLAPR